MSRFSDILTLSPIDGTAKSVVSQGDVSLDIGATVGDLELILVRFEARRVELKSLLGIYDAEQHDRLTQKFKDEERDGLSDDQWKVLTEYIANGRNIFNLTRHVSAEKKKSRFGIILIQ